jgi:hypothetical protein
VAMDFVVARNPDPDSRLPYLVRLPLEGGLILKVRDTWPRTSRVFCARVDGGWPSGSPALPLSYSAARSSLPRPTRSGNRSGSAAAMGWTPSS